MHLLCVLLIFVDLRELAAENITTKSSLLHWLKPNVTMKVPHQIISLHLFLPKLMLAHEHTFFSQTTKMSSKYTKIDFYFDVRFLLVSQLVETPV